jgi:Protein of unknown function (DUF4197)
MAGGIWNRKRNVLAPRKKIGFVFDLVVFLNINFCEMKKILFVLMLSYSIANAQFGSILKKVNEKVSSVSGITSDFDISNGLKEALNNGISKQVSKLTAIDGFFGNEAVKILMPSELQKVDETLRRFGMSKLADDGIKMLNRAAEDAVKEATPVFVNAIKNMSLNDAKGILMGNENAATTYLETETNADLYTKFSPVVQNSLTKVGADKVWKTIISKYNKLPLVEKVNPDLTDYVTNKALSGVFKMITLEEKNIRTDLNSRTSRLLQKVFAMQDNK